MMARCSLLTDPWWARASTGGAPLAGAGLGHDLRPACVPAAAAAGGRHPARPRRSSAPAAASASRSSQISLSRAVSRSASRRELANTSVERCAAIRSTIRSSTCGQIEARRSAPAAGPERSPVSSPSADHVGDRHDDLEVPLLGRRRLHDRRPAGRRRGTGPPPRPAGRSPTARPAGPAASSRASSRSRLSARWAPRLVPATACTSSRMTVSTPASASRACEVSRRNSDSGVVMRTSLGRAGEGAVARRPGCRPSGPRR